MKFDFKKIAAVTGSVLMMAMTAGTAMAASYPGPFVSGGAADVAIVYGQNALGTDIAASASVMSNLQSYMSGSDDGNSGSIISGGDSVQIAKSTDSFNLGDNINSFITTFDDDDLGTILADGTYKNDDNDEFDYTQEINLGSKTLTYFTDNDFNDEKPSIGFAYSGGDTILNYTLDFTPTNAEGGATDWNSLEGTNIEILGKDYYILSASNSSTPSLSLLDSANSGIVNAGETITIEAGDTSYEVSIVVVEDDDTAKLMVNGETTNSLDEDDTYKLDSGAYIGIKNVVDADFAGDTSQVEFSIGSGKIELVNGEEIELNGDDISDIDEYSDYVLNSYITRSGTGNSDLDKFVIEWKLRSGNAGDKWLAFDTDSTELVMPVFNNLKLSLGSFVTDAEEVTSLDPDGSDSFTLDTMVTDGEVNLNLLYANTTGTGFAGIGESSTQVLVTNSSTDPTISWDDNSAYFVATWIDGDDSESYVLEVSEIDDSTPADNSTTIRSVASGSNKAITLDIGDSDELGSITFTLVAASESAGTATINMTSTSGDVYADKIVTNEGLKIQLPVENSTSNCTAWSDAVSPQINLNSSCEETSWTMNLTEETESGTINSGDSFQIVLGFNSGETTVSSVTVTDYETEDGSDNYEGYVVSDLATKTLFATGGDQDSIDITYHGTESVAEVFLSELGASITAGTSSSSSTTQLGNVLFTDSEASSVSDKNLIVIGGSCVNSVAASLVGGAYCGAAFTEATGISAGQFMIKGYSNSTVTSKLALLVAGYDAADTTNAVTYLTTQTVDTSSNYKGTSATSATLVTEETTA